MFLGQSGQHLQLGGGVDGARRVAGVGDPDGARARRDELLDNGRGGQVEPLLGLRGNGHEPGQRGLGERVVVRVEGLGDQQLVAGVAEGHDGEPERLAAAVGDVEVVAVVGDVPGLVVGADGVAEVVVALRGRVGDGLRPEVPDGLEVFDEVARIANRVLLMNAGRLIGELDTTGNDLERAFFERIRQDDERRLSVEAVR